MCLLIKKQNVMRTVYQKTEARVMSNGPYEFLFFFFVFLEALYQLSE